MGLCKMPESQYVCERDKEFHQAEKEWAIVVLQYCRTLCSLTLFEEWPLQSQAGSYDWHPWQQIPTIWPMESNNMALCVQVACKSQRPDADSKCRELFLLT